MTPLFPSNRVTRNLLTPLYPSNRVTRNLLTPLYPSNRVTRDLLTPLYPSNRVTRNLLTPQSDTQSLDSPVPLKQSDTQFLDSPEPLKQSDTQSLDSPVALKQSDTQSLDSPVALKQSSKKTPPTAEVHKFLILQYANRVGKSTACPPPSPSSACVRIHLLLSTRSQSLFKGQPSHQVLSVPVIPVLDSSSWPGSCTSRCYPLTTGTEITPHVGFSVRRLSSSFLCFGTTIVRNRNKTHI